MTSARNRYVFSETALGIAAALKEKGIEPVKPVPAIGRGPLAALIGYAIALGRLFGKRSLFLRITHLERL